MINGLTIKDARGRRIEFREFENEPKVEETLGKAECRLLQEAYGKEIQGQPEVSFTKHLGPREVIVILTAMIPFILMAFLPRFNPVWAYYVVHSIGLAIGMGAVTYLWTRWNCRALNSDHPFVCLVLEHGHCPACRYDLRSLRPDGSDGCTICSECGGAWRLGPIG